MGILKTVYTLLTANVRINRVPYISTTIGKALNVQFIYKKNNTNRVIWTLIDHILTFDVGLFEILAFDICSFESLTFDIGPFEILAIDISIEILKWEFLKFWH